MYLTNYVLVHFVSHFLRSYCNTWSEKREKEKEKERKKHSTTRMNNCLSDHNLTSKCQLLSGSTQVKLNCITERRGEERREEGERKRDVCKCRRTKGGRRKKVTKSKITQRKHVLGGWQLTRMYVC